MASTYRKGWYYEYKLVGRLVKLGAFAVRAPASGRRARRLLYPDVVAFKRGRLILFEVAYRNDRKPVAISKRKLELYRWAMREHGAEAYLCVYYEDVGDFRCVPVTEYTDEDDREVRFSSVKIVNEGRRLEEILG